MGMCFFRSRKESFGSLSLAEPALRGSGPRGHIRPYETQARDGEHAFHGCTLRLRRARQREDETLFDRAFQARQHHPGPGHVERLPRLADGVQSVRINDGSTNIAACLTGITDSLASAELGERIVARA